MRKVFYRGSECVLAELCREHDIDRRTVVSRLDRGIDIEVALIKPVRRYPKARKRQAPAPKPKPVERPQRMRYTDLVENAADLMVDVREFLKDQEVTPQRERLLAGVRQWLYNAGWW
jgi:hypothetical protein